MRSHDPIAAGVEPDLPGFAAIDETTLAAMTSHAANPLLAAAAPLLALTARLRRLTALNDAAAMGGRLSAELRRFETTGIQAGVTTEQMRIGRNALYAVLTDLVHSAPWGLSAPWSIAGLRAAVEGENNTATPPTTKAYEATDAEEQQAEEQQAEEHKTDIYDIFALIDELAVQPQQHEQELALLHACLTLGFADPRAAGAAGRLQQLLQKSRPNPALALARPWLGVADSYRPLQAAMPLWVGGAVAAALLMFLYMTLAYALSGRADPVYQGLAGLLPNRAVVIARTVAPASPETPPSSTPLSRIAQTLAADVAAGVIAVLDDGDGGVMVRTRANGFSSGSDALDPSFATVIDRVGQALARESGGVLVVGHTDSLPIRSIRFPSNQALSEARARTVMNRLAIALGGGQRLSAEGRGAAEPIADNNTPDGRRVNRRIDILLSAP